MTALLSCKPGDYTEKKKNPAAFKYLRFFLFFTALFLKPIPFH